MNKPNYPEYVCRFRRIVLIFWLPLFPFACVIFLFPLSAHAYDADSGHVPLATLGLDLYNNCFPSQTTYQSNDVRSRLIQGNRGMDKGKWDMYRHLKLSRTEKKGLEGVSVFHLAHRVKNWHFYNPDRAALSMFGDTDQSFSRLWQELRKGFASNSGMNRWLFLGGLMHLVEDVAVPAHSIPVYHGPAAIPAIKPAQLKQLVSYMRKAGRIRGGKIKDPVDWIRPDRKRLGEAMTAGAEVCVAAGDGSETPEEIRDSLWRDVQALLQTQIPGCEGVAWSDFWILPVGQNYFGRYNISPGAPMFGERGTVLAQNGNSCEMKKDDARYADTVFELHQLAARADMKVLLWGANQPEQIANVLPSAAGFPAASSPTH